MGEKSAISDLSLDEDVRGGAMKGEPWRTPTIDEESMRCWLRGTEGGASKGFFCTVYWSKSLKSCITAIVSSDSGP